MNRLAVLVLCASLVAVNARTAYVCNVQLKNFDLPNPSLTVANSVYSFADDFNSISFGNFYAPSGDVEARSAVKNNVDVSAYSFGYEIISGGVSAHETHRPFSLVAGGAVNFNGGAFYPQGNGFPYEGAKEMGYGSSFSGPDYLRSEVQIGSRLDNDFDNAKLYYTTLSNAFANVAATATYSRESWGTSTVTCPDNNGLQYSVTVTREDISNTNFWVVNCNGNSTLLINVVGGTGSVTFSGNQVVNGLKPNNVLFNIPGDASTVINIQTEVSGSILSPQATYVQRGQGVVVGLVIVGDMAQVHQINRVVCTPPSDEVPVPTPTCLGFETNCAGLSFTLGQETYNFRDFNAISFGNFYAKSGDTEGRLAVKGNLNVNTYSVGDKIQDLNGGRDRTLGYSLVVGHDATFYGGLYPLGDIQYDGRPATRENAFVGGAFTSSADLVERRTGSCSSEGCLDSVFDAAKTCYEGFSNDINQYQDNAKLAVQWSGAFITCDEDNSTSYSITLDSSVMDTFTYWQLVNCNLGAYWFLNIRGSGDVNFHGDSFPAIPGGVVYNVIGARTVYVDGTAVAGHILAPNAVLNQTGGVILGKVVAADVVMSLQINRENTCPEPVAYDTPVTISQSIEGEELKRSTSRSVNMVTVGQCDVEAGDVINNNFGSIVIESVTEGSTPNTCRLSGTADYAITSQPAGTMIGKVTRYSTEPSPKPAATESQDSSAAIVGASVAALLVASLVI